MKNIYKKIILGLATILAIFGMVGISYAASPILTINPNPTTTTTTASFSVFYDMNGDILTSVAVRYGTNTLMTSRTSSQSPAATSGNLSFTASGLNPGTLYYFEAIGVSSTGTEQSSRYTFTTASVAKPTIQTDPNPTSITTNSATLSGFYSDNGQPLSSLKFEYGPTSSLGSSQSVFYGTSGTATTNIYGLSSGTKYWFRLTGTNAGGTVNGSTYYFVTKTSTTTNTCVINSFYPNTYSVNSGSPVSLSWSTTNCTSVNLYPVGSTLLNSSGYNVYPYSNTTYSLSASNGSTSDSKSFTITVNTYNPTYTCNINYFRSSDYNVRNGESVYLSWDSNNCSYLTLSPIGYNSKSESRYRVYPSYPSTTYRLSGPNGATNSLTVYVDRNNTCINCGNTNNNSKPSVTTNSVSNITSGGAVLHGYADGNGNAVDIWFEYGTNANLGYSTSRSYGGLRTNANGSLGGLSSNTTYYYRLVASNSQGTTYGNIMSFSTSPSTVYQNTNGGSTVVNRTINNTTNNRVIETADASSTSTSNSNQNGGVSESNVNNQDYNSSNSNLSASAGSAGFSIFPKTFLGWLILVLVILASIIIVKKISGTEYHDRGI